ncbi:EXO5 [Candida oxycetoniae]|uniref:Exonuclease V, mitochondrial n=1 Tax=Candida oxycetoniae TaxID=497107 RepID=A0AAI9SW34_9ASCO|nr:EXO5 [Candida oxycetoniae]KAI3403781.2 EXO5 [Candida oxycetoniae]
MVENDDVHKLKKVKSLLENIPANEEMNKYELQNQLKSYNIADIRNFEKSLKPEEKVQYVQSIIRQIVNLSIPEETSSSSSSSKPKPKPKVGRGKKAKVGSLKKDKLLSNARLERIYDYWQLPHNVSLPLVNPLNNGKSTPFQFYSTHNSDKSILKAPRLSITKLLIDNWCQLRDYYTIFSGNIKVSNAYMEKGSRHHAKLEVESHPESQIDFKNIDEFLIENVEQLKLKLIGSEGVEGVEEGTEITEELQSLINIDDGDLLAMDWCEKIVYRLFSLLTKGEAREILVHGYIRFKEKNFVEPMGTEVNAEQFEDSILVSGVVDLLQFSNPRNRSDLKMLIETRDMIKFEFNRNDDDDNDDSRSSIVDISSFLKEMKIILKDYNKKELALTICDVKSKTWNALPSYDSVLQGAKLQTFYYRYLFELLSQDEKFTYQCLLRNAELRGLDIDKPLSSLVVLKMLIAHYDLFYKDFEKLSNGENIGFEPYDEYITQEKSKENSSIKPYPFYLIFQMAEDFSFDDKKHESFFVNLEQYTLMINNNFDINQYLKPLLKVWKTPPTLRYFAARSSQFYRIFNDFVSDETRVEYHNSETDKIFKTFKYKYSSDELKSQIKQASSFWNGDLIPKPVDDYGKCKNCDFASKCTISLSQGLDKGENEHDYGLNMGKKMIGPMLCNFLSENGNDEKSSNRCT